jgi:diphthine-ammonia ligase
MTAAVSWSGGKDCCLAMHRARAAGLDVSVLLAMFDETGERTRSHAIPRALMQVQAEALGLELVAPSASWADYEPVFVAALTDLKARGITDVVFGDIDLASHREWEEKACAAAGVTPHLPLWQQDRQALADEVLRLGYRALVVCTDDRWLDAGWCGRLYDRAFLGRLPGGVDACGENGEFHTFVVDGPAFRVPVSVGVASVDSRVISFGEQSYIYHYARLALDGADAKPCPY